MPPFQGRVCCFVLLLATMLLWKLPVAYAQERPDLLVAIETVETVTPAPPGEAGPEFAYWVEFHVENIGSGEATAENNQITLRARIDNQWVAGQLLVAAPIPAHGRSSTTKFAADSIPLAPGLHTVQLAVDSSQAIAEENETNNLSKVLSFTVTGPVLTPTSNADLVALLLDQSGRTMRAQALQQCCGLWISYKIANTGSAPVHSSSPISAAILIDGKRQPGQLLLKNDLAPNEAASTGWFGIQPPLNAGSHTVQVLVDPDDRIVEKSESNNVSNSLSFVVATPGADLGTAISRETTPKPLTLYVDFDGVTVVNDDPEDSRTNHGSMQTLFELPRVCDHQDPADDPPCCSAGASVPIPRFKGLPNAGSRDYQIASITCTLRNVFREYDVNIVTSRPVAGGYTMLVVGGQPEDVCRNRDIEGGVSFGLRETYGENQIVYLFEQGMSSLERGAIIGAHETGHSLGLPHVDTKGAVMFPYDSSMGPLWLGGHRWDGGGLPIGSFADISAMLAAVVAKRATPNAAQDCSFPLGQTEEDSLLVNDNQLTSVTKSISPGFVTSSRAHILGGVVVQELGEDHFVGKHFRVRYNKGRTARLDGYRFSGTDPVFGVLKRQNDKLILDVGEGKVVTFETEHAGVPALLSRMAAVVGRRVMVFGQQTTSATLTDQWTSLWPTRFKEAPMSY